MGGTPRNDQSPAASPAKGKAVAPKKPSGKGVTKRIAKKPAAKKATTSRGKGRGHKKTYSDPRIQAAFERQRELRELYSQVAMVVKPVLEHMADQTVKELIEDENAYKEAPEFDAIQQQLDDQLEQVIAAADKEYHQQVAMTERTFNLDRACTEKSFHDEFNYLTEEFLDGARNRASILEELRREGLATNTPDLTYRYVKEVPYVSFVSTSEGSEASVEGQARQSKTATKRKAEGHPDGEADSKKPRHTGGLLASEKQLDGVPESNAPSPTPLEEQETDAASSKDIPDIPNGASEPDDYGVRSVIRRAKSPANRLIVTPLYDFDDDEIGFRDSTNDSTRKATRATRGKFVDTPNSSTWHWDHTVKDYDCREYKPGTLDPNLVQKHGLHPKYGLFLPNSRNEAESPRERVDGTRTVVVAPDSVNTHHASRSVRGKKMDLMLTEDARKSTMAMMLEKFCDKEDVDQDDLVTNEMRSRERQVRERLSVPSDDGEVPTDESDYSQQTEADDTLIRERARILLRAAEHLDATPQTNPSPKSRQSRPYDAVRDVFTNADPVPPRAVQHSEADTSGLSVLADAAEQVSKQLNETEPEPDYSSDASMIDPRLLGQPDQPPPPPNTFLQTALNPTSTFTHIAPAPRSAMEVVQQPTPPRIPFSNHNHTRDSPVLPPLRPNRGDGLGKGSAASPPQPSLPPAASRPQEFGSPRGLIQTNSGNYYPPAPSRPYHQGLSFHEPSLLPGSAQQGHPALGSGMMPTQPPPPPAHYIPPYHPVVSPPPPQSHTQIAPMPAQMEVPGPSVSPPGPPMLAPSPLTHGMRHRASIPTNGNGSGKYRKIAAAPIPHNRPWPPNGGTELRLAHYDHREAIKDYRANEPPPRSGPTTIRGWNVNNGRTNRNMKKEDLEEKESPK
ncbi:hypothetical protein GGR54DRAFT_642229 [Hypoxylon sp. NC1633]|nr:hypothetical protein GGR54DRAFT_642229 [Hypoxylon sp. NC1633]